MNIWRLNRFPLKFLWEVVARKSKECSPGSNCFLWTLLQESANYFLMKPVMNWYVNDKPCISKQKLSYLKKKWSSLLFWDGLKKLSQPRELPNLVPWPIKDALGTRLASHFKWSLKYLEAVVQRCSVIKVFLEISQNSQESTCARASILIKLQASPLTLLKKRLWHRCFSVNFAKFLRTPSLKEHLWWLLLNIGIG